MSITSQNALIGTRHVITTMRFLYDESFREIKGDIDAPANEAHAIGETYSETRLLLYSTIVISFTEASEFERLVKSLYPDQIRTPRALLVTPTLKLSNGAITLLARGYPLCLLSRTSAREIDDTVLFAYDRELLQFEHRLTTIGAIADSMEGHMQISTFQVRLQQMIETLASDGAKLQG
ncbi:hypothetical protein HO133_001006 [Letharia lupina]|uniref:Uncharacterized protein n=1 Tax=Letharia lupina TaxID=560253 RepID=A0A8H6CGI8_9LECA|nr:uncharacterized protein HO133_001006 [Letharia lupina]KAF6222955.1 hypothetical protein HO133_001006 [Letharia lupina]